MNIYKLILIGSDSNTYITIIVQKCRQKRLNKLYKFKYPTELCDFYPKKSLLVCATSHGIVVSVGLKIL